MARGSENTKYMCKYIRIHGWHEEVKTLNICVNTLEYMDGTRK